MERPPNEWDEGPGIAESIHLHKWLVILCMLGCALAAYLWSVRQPVRYEGVVQLFLDIQTERSVNSDRIVRREAELLNSTIVMDRVVQLLDGRLQPEQLKEQLEIEPAGDADYITIRALDATPELAAELANTVELAYRQVLSAQATSGAKAAVADLEQTERQLEKELASIERQLEGNPGSRRLQANLEATLGQLQKIATQKAEAGLAQRGGQPSTLRDRAMVTDEPAQPKPRRTAAVGGLIGLILGSALALWRTGWRATEGSAPAVRPPDGSGRELVRQGRQPLGSLLRVPLRRGGIAVTERNGSAAGNGSSSGIADFDQLTVSADQILELLEGRRQRLYEQDVPQLTADEIARQFPVDLVVVLLEHGDELLKVYGGIGLSSVERHMNIRHDRDRMQQITSAGPRLLAEDERALLASTGMPGTQVGSLVLVPLVHDGVGFGVLLAGQRTADGPARPLEDEEVEAIATTVGQLMPYLLAWVRLRDLRHRLEALR